MALVDKVHILPYVDIAAEVEGVARRLNGKEASELRGSVCSVLKRARSFKPNIGKDEQAALKTQKQDKSITILPADKGNATVSDGRGRIRAKSETCWRIQYTGR